MSISVVHAKMIIFGMLAREYRKYFKSIVDDSVIVGNQGISDGNSVFIDQCDKYYIHKFQKYCVNKF